MSMNALAPMAKRKAVSPIIATLLMVAVAVVGGILIFVFTQGFFQETDVSTSSPDNITVIGYDLSDVDNITDLVDANGFALSTGGTDAANTIDGAFSDNDYGTIYIENLGPTPIIITTVRVGGSSYLYGGASTAAQLADNSVPGDGKFVLCVLSTACGTAASQTGAIATMAAYSSATIVIEKDSTGPDLRNGNSSTISVQTDNGGVVAIAAKIGKQRGA